MAKNIVIFSDGTGQDGGVRPDQRLSNVYKMFRAARVGPDSAIDPACQVAFYDPGLGTDDDVHGFGRLWRTIGKFLASVAGRGIGTNIADCYEFVLNHWCPGDRIYIVGFSRGAYTARCVAQVISLCGVPTHEANQPQTPFRRFAKSTRKAAERAVHQVYEHGAGHPIANFEAERDEQARRFRADYGSDEAGGANAYPYFVGVFDTVAALGAKGWKRWGLIMAFAIAAGMALAVAVGLVHALFGVHFWLTFFAASALSAVAVWAVAHHGARRFIDDFPDKGAPRRTHYVEWHAANYDRGLSGHVGFARQASAIDEDRADFPRVPWGNPKVVRQPIEGEPPPLVQLWFAGNHSDIGGSYPEVESRLSDVSLRWMIEEVESLPHPLILDHRMLQIWPDPNGMQHSEVKAVRDKLSWMPRFLPAVLRNGWAYEARRAEGGIVHPSVHARFAAPAVLHGFTIAPYRPACFADDSRFRHFYSDKDAAAMGAARHDTLQVRIDDAPIIIDGGSLELARLLADRGADAAAVITTVDVEEEWDAYAVSLRLRELDRALPAVGFAAAPVDAPVEGAMREIGRFVIGLDRETAARCARNIGRSWFLMLDLKGRPTPVPAFAASV